MTFGVVIPYWRNRPPEEALAIALLGERYGFAEVWVGELDMFDAFALGGAIARSTRRITVTCGPLAVGVRSAAGIALGVASVSAIGGRPCRLALGTSSRTVVEGWHGRSWGDRPRQMQEAVLQVRRLARGRPSTAGGSARGFRLAGHEARGLHITSAAFGPRATEVAARVADRAVTNLVTAPQLEQQRTRLDELDGPPLGVWIAAAVDPTPEAVRQLSSQVAGYLAVPGYRDMFAANWPGLVDEARSGKPIKELAAAVPVELVEEVAALGSAQEVRGRLEQYAAAGAEDIGIVPVTAGDPAGERTLSMVAGLG